jgi:hypothetical protein
VECVEVLGDGVTSLGGRVVPLDISTWCALVHAEGLSRGTLHTQDGNVGRIGAHVADWALSALVVSTIGRVVAKCARTHLLEEGGGLNVPTSWGSQLDVGTHGREESILNPTTVTAVLDVLVSHHWAHFTFRARHTTEIVIRVIVAGCALHKNVLHREITLHTVGALVLHAGTELNVFSSTDKRVEVGCRLPFTSV